MRKVNYKVHMLDTLHHLNFNVPPEEYKNITRCGIQTKEHQISNDKRCITCKKCLNTIKD
ncbi:hypothetical protein [Alkaliphilus sp. B6464]|uniref:hypothetical protein n=1 Tax=Alkaliphilus sp. B6464 TaxID=2731219 RepID=UPI001BA61170|nr:hypothetical protein [Alkaliphilus sp. B6464]QUH21755.1 hypothetical protein HYG84_17620 [Alkaliphilus sp. B6464]